jgi:hypothetical protein
MPVTELGFFRLNPSTPITSSSLLANLLTAKHTCEAFTARNSGNKTANFRWEHCVEDPALIYYVGSWGSVAEHREAFRFSDDNKRLQRLIGAQMGIDQYFHLELDQSKVDVAGALDRGETTVMRHFVKPGQRGAVEKLFAAKLEQLRLHFGSSDHVVGGWRIDKEADDKEELVLFVGSACEGQRLEDEETILGGADAMDYFDKVERTHAVKLDVEVSKSPQTNSPCAAQM